MSLQELKFHQSGLNVQYVEDRKIYVVELIRDMIYVKL